MPLVIHLRKGQKAILNGAVIENASPRTISLAVRNEAKVLRSDDVLEPDSANTPATRVYFALQCAYLFADRTALHLAAFEDYLARYLAETPSGRAIAQRIVDAVNAGNLYVALKCAQGLIRHEAMLAQASHRAQADEERTGTRTVNDGTDPHPLERHS